MKITLKGRMEGKKATSRLRTMLLDGIFDKKRASEGIKL